jgi:nucleoid-associated protein YgaU
LSCWYFCSFQEDFNRKETPMTLSRRYLLSTGALIPAVVLAACSGTTAPTVTQLATDAKLIASGLAAAIASIAAIPGVSAATVATLQADLATVQSDAASIAAATATPATSVVSEIVQAVQAIAPIALSLIPGASAIVPIINAATSLLPGLLSAVGLSAATAGAKAPVYAPDQARLILGGAAAK